MSMAKIMETTIYNSIEWVEKQLKSNLIALKWEIEHTEDLRTVEGDKVKIYFGVTSFYGGVNVTSYIYHEGGHVPYYIKLTGISRDETKVMVAITGSEDYVDDYGDRNGNIAKQALEMCKKDCSNKSFKEKIKNFFK